LGKIRHIQDNNLVGSGKIKWLWMPIIIAVPALGVSSYLGADITRSCLWAVMVSVIAGSVGFAPVIYAARVYKSPPSVVSILAGITIRLLTMIAGTVSIIAFADINILWFVAWMGLFYIVILVMEACFVVRILKQYNQGNK